MKKILSAVIATFVSFIVFAEITVNGVVNSGNIISVADSEEITISGDAMGVVIIVRANVEANIVIDNLTIDNELSNVPAIQLGMGSSLNLTLKGVNTLYGAENFAALNVPHDTKLVIRGDGILHAESLAGGAGIGGNDGEHCGTVEIESGTISAFGGFEAAGIGGGCDGNGGNITIKGGYVYATALDSGAGIGGGAYGNGGNVVIVGGSVCAEGSFAMGTEDIGKGYGATDSGKLTNGKDNSNKNVYRCGLDKSMAEEEVSSVVVKVIKENEFNYDYKWDGDSIGSELDFYLPEGTFEAYIDGLPYEVAVTKDGYSWKQRMINIKANDVDISEGAGKGWKFASGELLIDGSDAVTLTGANDNVRIVIADGAKANVTISNLSIDGTKAYTSGKSVFSLGRNSYLNLTVLGQNTLTSVSNYAAINVPVNASLTITGDSVGKLTANGGDGASGIGGNYQEGSGKIVILSGNIEAKRGSAIDSPDDTWKNIGKGEGDGRSRGLTNGEVGGNQRLYLVTITNCNEDISFAVTNSSEYVYNYKIQTKGEDANFYLPAGEYYINEHVVNVDDLGNVNIEFVPPQVSPDGPIAPPPEEPDVDPEEPDEPDVTEGAEEFEGVFIKNITPQSVGNWVLDGNKLLITNSEPVLIFGESEKISVTVASNVNANVTISNLVLNATNLNAAAIAVSTNATLNLTISGTNNLVGSSNHAGINVPTDATLVITEQSEGYLSVVGGKYGAGIGGGVYGNGGVINIFGGTVEASGGEQGAGIGGGIYGDGGNVNISGGIVEANGGSDGAGIGGGYGYPKRGNGGVVNIFGGTVEASGEGWGAGIGGGGYGEGGDINISGGTVEANGGECGAGIGGGYQGDGADVIITGGSIRASGGNGAMDIGKGSDGYDSRTLTNGKNGGNQEVRLVKLSKSYGTNLTIHVTNAVPYEYCYNGDGYVDDDNLYFYLPEGESILLANNKCYQISINEHGEYSIQDITSGVYVNGKEVMCGNLDSVVLENNVLKITDSNPVTISGESEKISVTVASNVNANVTISNLVLNATNLNAAAIAVNASATLNLTILGTNNLVGSSNHAGINVPPAATLIVTEQSDGYLKVVGGEYGAGIGGGYYADGGVVNISGGTVEANGGKDGAGIGGGFYGDGADVIIIGGSVRVSGGDGAMDIGKGSSGYDSRTLTNGKNGGNQNVRLVKFPKSYGTNLTIHVTNAVPYEYCYVGDGYVDDDNLYFYLPEGESILPINNKCYQISLNEQGEYSINDISSGVYVNGKEVLYGNLDSVVLENDVLRITDSNPVVLSGSSDKFSVSIPKNMTANITASNLFFNVANTNAFILGEHATLNLTIVGDNELGSGENCAGIKVPYNSRLVITEASTGKMIVRGGENAAGIGGESKLNAGQVFVYGGYVNAIGGVGGAGIGGGANANGGFVEVVDGFLEALGGVGGAGIGGGANGEGGVVEIVGGSVKALGGEGAENIGKGRDGEGSGSLTNGEAGKKQNLCLVTYPYSTEVDNGLVEINVTNAQDYVYKFTAPECDIGDTLYFYLPMGEYKQFINGYAYNLAVTNLVETNSIAFVSLGKETGLLVDDVDIVFGECDALKYEGNVISIVTNSEVLFTGFTEDVVIEVPEGVTANLAISNAVLDAYYIESAAIIIKENAKLNLTVLGTNYIYGADGFAGINVPIGAALEVTTNSIGSLYVNGGAHAAGIGGNEEESFGDIVVLSGNIKSYGSARAADIGKGEDGGSQGQLTNGSVGGDQNLYPVKFPKSDTMVSVAVTNVKSYVYSFDGNGFEEDDYSTIYLPIGEYTVEIADDTYKAIVAGDESADTFIKMSGIYVNGFDAAFNYESNAVFDNNQLTIKDNSHYLITGSADDVSIYIESNYAYLTVSNLTLNVTNKSPIALGQLANLNLTVLGANSFTAGEGCAGINTSHGYLYITNESTGSLLAQGGMGAAGIGGNENEDFIAITINGGNIQAFGGEGAMDIGAGAGVENSTGKLTNGSLGGMQCVYRVTCPFAANGVSVTVTNASEYVYSCNPASTNTTDTMSLYLPNGEYTISIDDREYYAFVSDADTAFEKIVDTWVNGDDILDGEGAGWVLTEEGQLLITNSTPITITGVTSYGIKIAENVSAKLTVSNLTVSAGMSAITLAEGASLQLTVLGDNTLVSPAYCAGINVPLNTALIITQASEGTLSVSGGDFAAGIGGNNNESAGKVEIHSGTIDVAGGSNAAGIGGGAYGNGGAVKIYNGSITAMGGTSGAGIGGGWYGEGGNVDIAGGDVNAIGDTANGAENIGHGASVMVSGTLTSNGQPAMLVQYPYAKQITIIHPTYTYKYSDNGDNSSGTLNFYLPEVQQSKLRMSVGGTKVYVIESDTVYADKVYVADISSGVVQPEDRKDVTSEVVKMAKLDVQSDDATATISCDVADQALIQNLRVSYGESLDMLTTSPEFISPSVSTDGEATTLEVKMPKKSSMGFFSLKLQ